MSMASMIDVVLLTLKVGLVAVALIAIPGVALGYFLARTGFVLRAAVATLVALPMVLPPVAVGLLIVLTFARGTTLGRVAEALLGHPLLLSWEGAALASAVMSFPLLVLGAQNAFAAVPPRIEQVAATLGASRSRVFFRVTLPLASRGILHGFAFAFARALGEFGATTLVAGHVPGETETLALAIYARIENFDDGAALRLCVLSIVVALVFTGGAEFFLRPRKASR
jgi:molybdate transport system permease protein